MRKNEPIFVSVFIQSYNHEHYVKAAIESVLRQSYQNFELLIIDDGSTDNSQAIIQKVVQTNPDKIGYLNLRENIGLTGTYNEAIKHLQGDLFVAISSDDLLQEDALQKRVRYMVGHPDVDLFAADFDVVMGGRIYRGALKLRIVPQFTGQFRIDYAKIYEELLSGNFIQECALSFNLRNIDKTSIFYDDECPNLSDYDQLLRLSRKYRWGFLPEPVVIYRWHGRNISCEENPGYDSKNVAIQKLYILQKQLMLPQLDTAKKIINSTMSELKEQLEMHQPSSPNLNLTDT